MTFTKEFTIGVKYRYRYRSHLNLDGKFVMKYINVPTTVFTPKIFVD